MRIIAVNSAGSSPVVTVKVKRAKRRVAQVASAPRELVGRGHTGSMRIALGLLVGAALSLAATPAQAQAAGWDSPVLLPDRVIVRWEPGTDQLVRAQGRADVNAVGFRGLGKRFQTLYLEPGQDTAQAVAELRQDPAVAAVGRDGYVPVAESPNDPLFGLLWGLRNPSGPDIDALQAWTKTRGEGVIAADLDYGIRPEHPDLKNQIWHNTGEVFDSIDNDHNGYIDDTSGWDFVGDSLFVDPWETDNDPTDGMVDSGHGVHTAGTIAAQADNGIGMTGVAPGASLMALRVCVDPGCPWSAQIEAANYASANGARVANLSIAGMGFEFGEPLMNEVFAANPNVLFVIAAGNDANNNDVVPTYPCVWNPSSLGSPDNVVCVAATDADDSIAVFSSWGATTVDIAAPGVDILSTYPVTRTPGDDFLGPTTWAAPGQENETSYGYLQGTSMAAPHVTGAAALLAAYEPTATTMQLKHALLSSVDRVADLDPQTGSHPVSSGGRLNADKALDAVDALVAPDTAITSAPVGSTPQTAATITFGSPARTPVAFECRVDSGAFSACVSPLQLSGVAAGVHAVEVRAKDTHGNLDPTPATATWTVQLPTVSAPAKVTGVKVKRSKKKAVIRWTAVPGATSYKVTVGKTTKTITKPTHTLKLKATKKATVKITAVNSAGSSAVVTVKVKRAQ